MLERILRFSVTHRWLVVLGTILAAAVGLRALLVLPVDAVPDVTNRQVQVNVGSPALSTVEMERLVTFPVEAALAGSPGLDHTRSLSRAGFAQITAVFRDDVDVYFARQQVGERLDEVRDDLPEGTTLRLGPVSTGLGEVYMWAVTFAARPAGEAAPGAAGWQADGAYRTPEGRVLATDVERTAYLREVQDWIIAPQVRTVPGVADVDTIGGHVKQYQVRPDPRRLAAYGLGLRDLVDALRRNNLATGAGWVEQNGETVAVLGAGRLGGPEALADVPVAERGGVPIHVRDLATVGVGGAPRTGTATMSGEEIVLGTALMLIGANGRAVAAAVDARLREVAVSLPPDVVARTVLDRTALVDATVRTVTTNLLEGALLVVLVLFVALGHVRAAVIAALAIPLSMLLAAIGMVETRTSGNLMSLGAIDFGLVVDGAVIIVENCLRRLGAAQRALGRPLVLRERLDVVYAASAEVRTAASFGEAIIIVVYLPILALTGVAGKMFAPMATTVVFALLGAFVLSLTFVPAMVAIAVTGPVRESDGRVMDAARRLYEPVLRTALDRRRAVVGAAALLVVQDVLYLRRHRPTAHERQHGLLEVIEREIEWPT
ncbi:MAG TPA: efflux RND transporter permease subunit, partial [Actinomycetota bacterium]